MIALKFCLTLRLELWLMYKLKIIRKHDGIICISYVIKFNTSYFLHSRKTCRYFYHLVPKAINNLQRASVVNVASSYAQHIRWIIKRVMPKGLVKNSIWKLALANNGNVPSAFSFRQTRIEIKSDGVVFRFVCRVKIKR